MAKMRIRTRDPENTNTKITVVRSVKGKKLHNKLKIVIGGLIISLIANGYLSYLLVS